MIFYPRNFWTDVLILNLIILVLFQIWKHDEQNPPPSPYWATIRAVLQAGFCMGLYLYLVPQFPLSRFIDPVYHDWPFWKRLGYQYMAGFTARWKYYFIWSISEASIIISGLGFSGWTKTSPPKACWDRAKNVDILGLEFVKSAVEIPLKWNIQVSTWLRHCESFPSLRFIHATALFSIALKNSLLLPGCLLVFWR